MKKVWFKNFVQEVYSTFHKQALTFSVLVDFGDEIEWCDLCLI